MVVVLDDNNPIVLSRYDLYFLSTITKSFKILEPVRIPEDKP